MKTIHAIWKNGRVLPDQPVDWPDGTALIIEPIENTEVPESEDDLLGNSPEAIARWVAYVDSLPRLEMTAEEEAEWQAARQEMKAYAIAKMRSLDVGDEERR